MKVTVIGCGNAFSAVNFNQSFLLEEDGKRLLVDCGQQVLAALRHHQVDVHSIDAIYVSHLHADHVGSLEAVAFLRYDWKNRPRDARDAAKKPPELIANSNLLKELWDKTLRGGLESMEGFDATMETFFLPRPVVSNQEFEWQGWTCRLIQQIHIMTGSMISNTFGLFMTKPGKKSVYFTTDSQHCSPRQVEVFYKQADLIFQDCEISPLMSGVHANYVQLAGYPEANSIRLADETKAKMWLSHYQDFVLFGKDHFGNEVDWAVEARKDGFAGFVKLGQRFEV